MRRVSAVCCWFWFWSVGLFDVAVAVSPFCSSDPPPGEERVVTRSGKVPLLPAGTIGSSGSSSISSCNSGPAKAAGASFRRRASDNRAINRRTRDQIALLRSLESHFKQLEDLFLAMNWNGISFDASRPHISVSVRTSGNPSVVESVIPGHKAYSLRVNPRSKAILRIC